jgi:hypothetical protein
MISVNNEQAKVLSGKTRKPGPKKTPPKRTTATKQFLVITTANLKPGKPIIPYSIVSFEKPEEAQDFLLNTASEFPGTSYIAIGVNYPSVNVVPGYTYKLEYNPSGPALPIIGKKGDIVEFQCLFAIKEGKFAGQYAFGNPTKSNAWYPISQFKVVERV